MPGRTGHGDFEKWRAARALADAIMAAPESVPAETLDAFAKIAAT